MTITNHGSPVPPASAPAATAEPETPFLAVDQEAERALNHSLIILKDYTVPLAAKEHHAKLIRERFATQATALAALRARVEAPEILGLIEGSMAAHKVLDQFGAPRETGDTLADRITMLRDSYEHRLAALAPRQTTEGHDVD